MLGHTGMHCLALSQHGKNVLGFNLSDNWALPVWSLQVLIMPGLVSQFPLIVHRLTALVNLEL